MNIELNKIKSWLIFVIRATISKIYYCAVDKEFTLLASALAFTTTLTIIPLLAISFSMFKYVGGVEDFRERILPLLFDYLAAGASQKFINNFNSILHAASGLTLSIVGFFALAYTSSRLFSQIEIGIQKVWNVSQRRVLWQRLLGYAIGLVGAPLGFALVLGLIGHLFILGEGIANLRVISFSAGILFLFGINKWIPCRKVHSLSALFGSVTALVGLIVLQKLFVLIISKLLLYNKIYGSFASIPFFLLWLQLAWKMFFFGVIVSVGVEKRIESNVSRIP